MKKYADKAPKVYLFCLIIFLPVWLWGQQSANIEPSLHLLLERASLELFEPLDAGYRIIEPFENSHLNCQFAIYSRREDLEIRFFILPWDETDPNATAPHVTTFRALTAIASNADDAVISAIKLEEEKLAAAFNADWGMAYFFKPKSDFSMASNCKMLAISKTGKGTVFVFYLFEEAGNTSLDTREVLLRFTGF